MRKALPSHKKYPAALNNLGLALYDQNHYADAIQCWGTIVTLDPQDFDAWFWMGRAFHHGDQYEEACRCHEHARRLAPDNPTIWLWLGHARFRLSFFESAARAYELAVENDSNMSDAWLSLGITLRRIGQQEEATAALRQCIALDPNNSVAANNLIGCLESIPLHLADDSYRDNLRLCLERNDIDPNRLHPLVSAYLLMDRRWQDLSQHDYF